MPYDVMKDHSGCPESKPYAVVKSATGEKMGCHESAESAAAQIRAIEMSEQHSIYIVDEFLAVKPGKPFRLFKFGKIVKNGKERELTEEMARKFKLPHYRPAIKLGSHKDTTPAGGHLIGLEVRADGLYGLPEWNEKGIEAIESGAYRYHSPEVVWEGGFENPTNGELIEAPLIVGAALLHDPHLGEQTAFYHAETQTFTEAKTMSEQNMVQVPETLWEKFMAFFDEKPEEPTATEEPEFDVEQFEAVQEERDAYKAELEALRAEGELKTRVEHFAAEFEELDALNEDAELFERLAKLSEEDADFFAQRLKAVGAQVDEGLTKELGSQGEGVDENPSAAFHAEIARVQTERDVSYDKALEIVTETNPALYEAYEASLRG